MSSEFDSGKAIVPVILLLLVMALLATIAAAPFLRIQSLEQEIETNSHLLAKLRKELVRESKLRGENKGLIALGQDESLLLDGATTGIAGANLQKLVNTLVLQQVGTASSYQILPPKADGNLTRIAMSFSINIGIDGLRDILYTLETGTPLVFVDGLTIRTSEIDREAAGKDFLGPFDVTMLVSGFVPQGEGSNP